MSLSVGALAPDFALPTDGNGEITLSQFKGRKVVLYFYPKDNTPGCTTEACAFREAHPDFTSAEAEVIGISKDSVASHDKFKARFDLPFRLAADVDGAVCEAYGVWKEKCLYGKKSMGIERTTVLIDSDGVVRKVWPRVRVNGHAELVLKAVREL